MIINITSVDNRFVSRKDLFSISYPDLIEKINSIIDWEHSTFPEEIDLAATEDEPQEPKLVENRKALGDDPKLKEGVTFYYKNQLFYVVDKNSLGLVNTDTGILGLIRVVNDFILSEYKIKNKLCYLDPLEVENIKSPVYKDWFKTPIYSQTLKSCEFTKESIEDKRKIGEPNLRLPYFIVEFLKENFPEIKENKMTIIVNSPKIDLFDETLEITPTGKVYYDEDNFADDIHVRSEILSLLAEKMTKDI